MILFHELFHASAIQSLRLLDIAAAAHAWVPHTPCMCFCTAVRQAGAMRRCMSLDGYHWHLHTAHSYQQHGLLLAPQSLMPNKSLLQCCCRLPAPATRGETDALIVYEHICAPGNCQTRS